MPLALEREAEHDQAHGQDERGRVRDDEARLGVDAALVPPRVEAPEGVVQPMAREPAEEHADDAEEVEEAWRSVSTSVELGFVAMQG